MNTSPLWMQHDCSTRFKPIAFGAEDWEEGIHPGPTKQPQGDEEQARASTHATEPSKQFHSHSLVIGAM